MSSVNNDLTREAWASDWRTAVRSAFPAGLLDVAMIVADNLSGNEAIAVGTVRAYVDGESVRLPGRVSASSIPTKLRVVQDVQLATDCILTRHHNGYVRHDAVRRVLAHDRSWIAPFVVILLGEYVVEIVETIAAELSSLEDADHWQFSRYGRFASENQDLLLLTRQRAISYWNCYYRKQYPSFSDYPAAHVLTALDAASQRYGSV